MDRTTLSQQTTLTAMRMQEALVTIDDRIKAATILRQLETPEKEKFQAFLVQFSDEDFISACKRIGIEDVSSAPIEKFIQAIQTRIPSQRDLHIVLEAAEQAFCLLRINCKELHRFIVAPGSKNYLTQFYHQLNKSKLMREKIAKLAIYNTKLEVLPSLPGCKLHSITLSGKNDLRHTSLQNLEALLHLKSFTLLESTAEKPFEFLPKRLTLSEVSIFHSDLESLNGLEKVSKVCSFTANACIKLTDISALYTLKELSHLTITNTTSLIPHGLSNFPLLTFLNLSGCSQFTTFKCIENLPKLEYLDISRTGLRTLEGIERLQSLMQITFNYLGDGVDISALKRLRQLSIVNMADCMNETAVRILTQIESLKDLNLIRYQASICSLACLERLRDRLKTFCYILPFPGKYAQYGMYATKSNPSTTIDLILAQVHAELAKRPIQEE